MVELGDFLHRRPSELSGGQRQRVALARAIVREPTVFLMDEPLSNLDAKLRVSTRARIKNLHHELKTTTIYVTHDQIEAMTLADRVVVMNNGLVQQVGTPIEIYDRPANIFVAGFIGSPAMNLVPGVISNGLFKASGITLAAHKSLSDGPVTLGFRAEDAQIGGDDITGALYSLELLGDSSMVTMDCGGTKVVVKAAKEYRASIGQNVSASLELTRCQWFDSQTEALISIKNEE
jgi:multiple sugar transport system ATP-binding protein